MANDVISNDYGETEVISSDSGDTETVDVAKLPPNAPLDFGTLNKIATNLPALSTVPTEPNEGWVYLDDGSNTLSGNLALRIYWNGDWQAVGKGAGEDKTYIHSQDSASDTWDVTHGLNKKPSVTVVDSAETVVLGDVEYVDNNEVKIYFDSQFSGKAYFN